MRRKNLILIILIVIATSILFIILGPAGEQNSSFNSIVSQTHQQIKDFQANLRGTNEKILEIDEKYLQLLGFTKQPVYNGTKANFSIITYVLNGQIASTILLAQNIAAKLPNDTLLIYDLGLNINDLHTLNSACNTTKCIVITYDFSQLPSYILDDNKMHAFRPIVIQDALQRSKIILFIENNIRIHGSNNELNNLIRKTELNSGILGWTTSRQAVSSRTHPRTFYYFQTDADSFLFLPMVSMDFVIFVNNNKIINDIMLQWIKCTLTLECIHPIGAQSAGCKYNKKPQYRYSGCHSHDESIFNILLGLTWSFDETKYSISRPTSGSGGGSGGGDTTNSNDLFYTETLEQSTKILEMRRKNISDTSEHPFIEE